MILRLLTIAFWIAAINLIQRSGLQHIPSWEIQWFLWTFYALVSATVLSIVIGEE